MRIGINSRYLTNDLCGFYKTITDLTKLIVELSDQNNDEILFFGGNEKHINHIMKNYKIKYKIFKDKVHWLLADLGLIYKKKYFKNIDIFYSPVFISPIYLEKKTNSIVIVHDLDLFEYPNFFSRKLYLIYGFFLKRSLKRANNIICISKTTGKKLNKYLKGSSEKTTIIYPTIDPLQIKEKIFNSKDQYFLSIAPEHPRKNFECLVKSFNLLEKDKINAKLLIIGKIPYWAEKEIINKSNINSLGFVDDKQKDILLANSLATIVASYSEGFCYPVFESLKNGTPVITTNIEVFKETIGKFDSYQFNPEDYYKLSRIIKKFISDKSNAKKLFEFQLNNAKKIESFDRITKFRKIHIKKD